MATYTEYWIDYSARKLSAQDVANSAIGPNGEKCTGAIRYIDAPELLDTKHTNLAEYQDYLNHGLKVRLVHQGSTTDADGGYQAGVARAQRAKAGADYLGYTGVIYFTNDRPDLPNVTNWQQYLRGAGTVLGPKRVGAYGFANAMNAAQGYASAFWQSGRESDLVSFANVYQWNNGRVYVAGTECDLNKVVRDYVPDLSSGGQTPGTEIEDEEDDMEPAKTQAPSPGVTWSTLYFDGKTDGVLNIVPIGDVVFMGPVYTWGPGANLNVGNGTGGGQSTVPGVNPARVEINQPGQYRVPKGTTRVTYSYSCAGAHIAKIERV